MELLKKIDHRCMLVPLSYTHANPSHHDRAGRQISLSNVRHADPRSLAEPRRQGRDVSRIPAPTAHPLASALMKNRLERELRLSTSPENLLPHPFLRVCTFSSGT